MRLTYLENGETLSLDPSLCRGCGRCVEVCPHAVFRISDSVSSIVDKDACMECGACMRNCAHGAVRVTAGVGCAAAVIGGMIRGTPAECGSGGGACCGPKTAGEEAALAVKKQECCSTRP